MRIRLSYQKRKLKMDPPIVPYPEVDLYKPRIVMTQERFQRILSELQFLRKRYARACGSGSQAGEATVPDGPIPDPSAPESGDINLFILKEQIDDLEEKLRIADVVSPSYRECVYFGSTVKVRDVDRDKVAQFHLVGPEEIDATGGKISSASPIGRSLLGRKVGDIVTVSIPKGILNLKILEFS
jgi:transcription elongation factor GreA